MGPLIYFLVSHMQFWAAAVIAYFCGCFNGAVIVSKYILRDDVRGHGSGNAGLTNFYRTFGGPLTFVVILTDVLKAVVAVLVGVWLTGQLLPIGSGAAQTTATALAEYWSGLFCLLGHMFPCMFQFKGGKGILSGGTIAIMIEPVQGEGGVHPATQEFMTGLREFCDENGMLLLIDEVQTGWCRTGAVMSYMNYGIKPDIVSMAKGLGGGMPIGAICATEEVAKAFTPGSHGTTFGGHPVSCAAAYAEVGELLDRDLAGNAKKMGDYFSEKLAKMPHVKEVRHQGLLVGVEFDDAVSGVEVKHACLDRKLLITAIGAHTIRMVPPLIVNEEQCDKAVEIITEAVEAVAK